MPELGELTRAAVEAAQGDEAVEAFAEEGRTTEASALRGEVEGLTFAEQRGVGVRLISDGRLGYAWAADPSLDEVRDAVRRARENAALAERDEFNVLPSAEPITPIPELFREDSAEVATDHKVELALELERLAISSDPRVTKIDLAQVGDAVSRVAIASTAGVDAEYARTDAWAVVVTLAVEGDETQTGFSYRVTRALDELDAAAISGEAVERWPSPVREAVYVSWRNPFRVPRVKSSVRPLGTPSSSNGEAPGPSSTVPSSTSVNSSEPTCWPAIDAKSDRPFSTASALSAPASTPRNDIAAN